jgi:4-diphosphocytidyl-2-C-methyl-D-erythritol kinase
MLVFPNCKINIGLHVVEKRSDGFHAIETAFYPVNWTDTLEVIEGKETEKPFSFNQTGLTIAGGFETNLIYKAWQLISCEKKLPPLSVHLHKILPMGAGLGGGSSDAAFFINLINEQFALGLSEEKRLLLASELGSDCAFFIKNVPLLAFGRGNEFKPVQLDLSDYYILVIYPGIHSNTKEAYNGLSPKKPLQDLRKILANEPLSNWRYCLVNDFEPSIFEKYPDIKKLKQLLYDEGAVYASMSGSGSAVYGLFEEEPRINLLTNYSYCLQKPKQVIL